MKKLIPALCMLLIAAAMLGTSTYAWFSMNTTVTASSMTVKATTDANLVIAKGASVALASVTGTSVSDLNVSNTSIYPADMSNSSGTVTVRYPTAYSSNPTVSTAGAGSAWQPVGTLTATTATDNADPALDLDNYCAYAFVTIARKQTTPAAFNLAVTCSVTFGTASKLNKALRVGVITNGNFYKSDDAGTNAAETVTFTIPAISNLADNTAHSVCLVFWFEGEDSDCTANNAETLSTNVATWSFVSSNYVAP